MSGRARERGRVHNQETTVSSFGAVTERTDRLDDPCTSRFQILGSKKRKKNKLIKRDTEMNEQSVNPFLFPSISSDNSSIFPLRVDNQDTEDKKTQQQKSRNRGKDTGDDSCASSFQLLDSPKKKKKNKLGKHYGEKNERLQKSPLSGHTGGTGSESVILDKELLEYPVQDLETATRELEEFIPHVRTLSHSLIKQLARRDLARFKQFKKQAQGIPRPWRFVYHRARKMFDPRNYNGRYSKREKKKLQKYQALYGNKWKKISELMNRSSHSLHLKYDEMKSKFNSGAWSKEETKKLLDTMKEILWAKVEGLDSTLGPKNMDQAMLLRENLYKDIPWFRVEAKVGTRRWKQCKRKWLYFVTKTMSQGKMKNRGIENLRFKINFIERLYELGVEDIDDIDWEDLSRIIGNVPPDYVRNRFYKIKSIYVPCWNTKTFPEIIDYLHKKILPKLRSKVAGKETKEVATEDEDGSWKRAFKFNEIFQYDDDLIEEEEEEEEPLRGGAVNDTIQRNSVNS